MLSEADLPLRLIEPSVFIDFLGPQDEPWLRVLVDEMARFDGRRRRELCERLAEPLPCEAPPFKRRAACRVLLGLWRRERVAALEPRRAREHLFTAAAALGRQPARAVAAAAAALGVAPDALDEALFADVPSEHVMRAPDPLPGAGEIALRTNLAIAQALLMRASSISLRLLGAARPVVRLAKLRGLLCTVVDPPVFARPRAVADFVRPSAVADFARPSAVADFEGQAPGDGRGAPGAPGASGGSILEISGPFSLFRHTLLYGRALAELLPHLAWCARFELQAEVAVRGRIARFSLGSGDPILPVAAAPAAFDSRLEERFARDIARLAPDWDVVREPEPVRAAGTLIFPDFLLRHRIHTHRRVLIEVAGFWTPAYVSQKLERLRQARLRNLILCVDDDRGCGEGELPAGARVVRFHRRIDAAAVLREVEQMMTDVDARELDTSGPVPNGRTPSEQAASGPAPSGTVPNSRTPE